MPPHYLHKRTGKQSVVLLDDRYSSEEQPEDQFLVAVVEALQRRGLVIYPHNFFSTVGNLIVHHRAPWSHDTPAPSAWLIDIELTLGRHLHERVCDGIGLARYLRHQDIQRPNQQNQWSPIPILFLTRFGINDIVPCALDPSSNQPLLQRIRSDVQVGWLFFRKNWTDPNNLRVDEESVGGPVRSYTLEEFADKVWRAAEG